MASPSAALRCLALAVGVRQESRGLTVSERDEGLCARGLTAEDSLMEAKSRSQPEQRSGDSAEAEQRGCFFSPAS